LDGNNIGDEGAAYLAIALTIQQQESSYSFVRFNNITSKGAKALAIMLKSNTSLNALDISENKIGTDGAHYFQLDSRITTL